MYLLSCPNCQAELKITPARAGDSVPCPECGKSVDVPKLGELRSLPRVADDDQNSVGKPTPADGSRSVVGTVLFVPLALITVGALLVVG